MFVESSKDILYLVIAFCVIWITVFVCWMFYYVMRLLRNTNDMVEELRTRLQSLLEGVNYLRGKMEHITGLLTLVTEGATGLVKKVVAKKAKEWVDGGLDQADGAAKAAVDRAVAATAEKMHKAAKKFRK